MVLAWIRRLMKRGPMAPPRPCQRPQARPALEPLEGRWTPSAVRTLPGLNDHALERVNDDNSVRANVGFNLAFYGVRSNNVFVNENGNLSFREALPTFDTPSDLTAPNGGNPIIAPFFADVDTSNPASNIITYGTGRLAGFKVFAVTWHDVGYFTDNPDIALFNTFQVILISRPDTGPRNFDIEFNYDQVEWETGDNNQILSDSGEGDGSGFVGPGTGLGGQSARVGYSSGVGNPAQTFELGGSGVFGSLTDTGLLALINNSRLASTPGRYHFLVRNGQVASGMNLEVTSTTRVFAPLRFTGDLRTLTMRGVLTLTNLGIPTSAVNQALDLVPPSPIGPNGAFPGPITVVFRLPPGVRAVNPTGYTGAGDPYVTVPEGRMPRAPQVLRVEFTLRFTSVRALTSYFAGFPVRVFAGPFDRLAL